MIPYGRQSIDDDDIAAVLKALKGDWLTQGPHVEEFEQAIVSRTGARYAVAFANGTAGLHAATSVAGLRPGSTVTTSPLTFVASANCARYVGASVRFIDVDLETWNLAVEHLPPCDAVVAVHYAGLPVDLSKLPFRPTVVIEDASHALGAETPDGPVGNCARSDLTCFSFHPVKHVTTGEGGAVTTNDADLAERLRRFRHHQIVPQPGGSAAWAYDVTGLGFNYRLTDLQAALGTSQLSKLDRFLARRRALAARYRELLVSLPIILPPEESEGFLHAYHLFPVLVPQRQRVYEGMRDAGIGVQVHYIPVYRLSLYAADSDPAAFPATENIYGGILSLPLFPDLSLDDQDFVVKTLTDLL